MKKCDSRLCPRRIILSKALSRRCTNLQKNYKTYMAHWDKVSFL